MPPSHIDATMDLDKLARYIVTRRAYYKLPAIARLGLGKSRGLDLFIEYLKKVQYENGAMPLEWRKGLISSNEATLRLVEVAAEAGFEEEFVQKALKHIHAARSASGFWYEYGDAFDGLVKRKCNIFKLSHTCFNLVLSLRAARALIKCEFSSKNEFEQMIDDVTDAQRYDGYWVMGGKASPLLTSLVVLYGSEVLPQKCVEKAIRALKDYATRKIQSKSYSSDLLIVLLVLLKNSVTHISGVDLKYIVFNEMIKQSADGGLQVLKRGVKSNPELTCFLVQLLSLVDSKFSEKLSEKVEEKLEALRAIRAFCQDNYERALALTREELRDAGVFLANSPHEIFFKLLLYSYLRQIFWASEHIDIDKVTLSLIIEINRGKTIEDALKTIARKYQLPQHLMRNAMKVFNLIRAFTEEYVKKEENIEKVIEKFVEYTIFRASKELDGYYRENLTNLGLLLRAYYMGEKVSLTDKLNLALKSYPGVGDKTSVLFMFLLLKVFSPKIGQELDEVSYPVTWDVIRPLAMLKILPETLVKARRLPAGSIDEAYTLAQELFPENSALLYGLRVITKKWCRKFWRCVNFTGEKCPFYDFCPSKRKT